MDLKDAYKHTLKKSLEDKIFDTIPDHYFWDIKKPQQKPHHNYMNRYNGFRGKEFNNFFEMRNFEEWIDENKKRDNNNITLTYYKRY